jgi:hypothetical protein
LKYFFLLLFFFFFFFFSVWWFISDSSFKTNKDLTFHLNPNCHLFFVLNVQKSNSIDQEMQFCDEKERGKEGDQMKSKKTWLWSESLFVLQREQMLEEDSLEKVHLEHIQNVSWCSLDLDLDFFIFCLLWDGGV